MPSVASPIKAKAAARSANERRTAAMLVETQPASREHHLGQEIVQEIALARRRRTPAAPQLSTP